MMMMMDQREYSFPILDPTEITECLGELQVGMEPAEVSKPGPERVRQCYERLVEFLVGTSQDEFGEPCLEAQSLLEYPELHQDSFPEVAFLRVLTQLMYNVGVKDFNIRTDLLIPNGERFRRNMSALINFAKFREDRLNHYHAQTKYSEDLEEKKRQLLEQREDLWNQLQALQQQRTAEEPRVKQLTEECARLEGQVIALNKQQYAMQNEGKALKNQHQELIAQLTTSAYASMNAKQDLDRLKARIVPSPEKVKKVLEDMANTVESEKAAAAESEKRGRDFQARFERTSRALKTVNAAAALVRESLEEKQRSKQFSAEIDALSQACDQINKQIEEAETNIQHLRRLMETAQETSERRKVQLEEKRRKVEEELKQAKEERRTAERDAGSSQQQMAQLEGQRSAIARKMEQMTREHDSDVRALKSQLNSLQAQVIRYHRALQAGFAAASPDDDFNPTSNNNK